MRTGERRRVAAGSHLAQARCKGADRKLEHALLAGGGKHLRGAGLAAQRGNLEPAGSRRTALGLAGADEERSVGNAYIDAERQGGRAFPGRDESEHAGHMRRLEPALRACLQHGAAHHAAGNGHVGCGKLGGVEHHQAWLDPALERPQRAGCHLGEVGVFVGENLAGRGHALEQARVALAGKRHNLVAHEGAQVARVGVGGVLVPLDAAQAEQGAEFLVRAVEQRPHDAVAAPRDGREALGAGAGDGMHEEGLGAVVCGVGRGDAGGRAR